MHIKRLLIGVILFFYSYLFSQNTKVNYTISFCGRPQTLQLIKYENEEMVGFLETRLEKRRKIKSKKSISVYFKNKLSKIQTESLISKLQNAGIDSLISCKDDEQCKQYAYLDADYLVISTCP